MSILDLEEVNIAEYIPMELLQGFNPLVEACWSRAFAPILLPASHESAAVQKGFRNVS